ncbi:MAG TPA: VOC family protein, partial [Acidimicrobiales bacterium]|nr:VOC family protein [Acidimicrobiales bacterium]
MNKTFPSLRSVVLDTMDARALAEFYRLLLGYEYRAGDETPPPGEADPKGREWLTLVDPEGKGRLAFQHVGHLPPSTWPADGVPQQLHLDFSVSSRAELTAQDTRARSLGARRLEDRFDDPDEPLDIYAVWRDTPFASSWQLMADPIGTPASFGGLPRPSSRWALANTPR